MQEFSDFHIVSRLFPSALKRRLPILPQRRGLALPSATGS
jgi:hypothetical protein